MEKNITPTKQKPSFFKTFIYVLFVFIILQLLFGNKKEENKSISIPKTKQKVIERNLIPFETESLKGNFNSIGLRIDDVILKKYKQTINPNSQNIELLKYISDETKSDEKSSYIEFGFLSNEPDENLIPTEETKWKVLSQTDNGISLSWTNKNGVNFIRDLSFDENYMLTIKDKITNNSKENFEIFPYARVVQSHNMYEAPKSSHIGFVGFLDGALEEHTYNKISKEKTAEFSSKNGWLGFGSDYFMTILIPNQNNSFTARVLELQESEIPTPQSKTNYKQFQADYVRDIITIEHDKSEEITSQIYIGAKVSSIISKYEEKFSIPKFDLVIDYGYFYILSKPFTIILKWLDKLTGNFGLAIILFTIMIRAILFPIAQKSFKSMEKMKKMQPEMKRIQTLYANNKQQMNIELAMLYKKSGVNPLSGCLPLLLQIPVFLALYKSLVISIEMRQAPFFGWIQDLSAPDPTTIFNLFGLLPFEPWVWLPHIGVLPVIMGITMYIQQTLQPAMASDPTQAKIMKFLPLIFTVMFAGLPSGLILYWTVNNILSIIQQKYIR
ncbi:membrane protein insertase YidC [bacterium]|nr:membrane protein insertase YidC [bacterium]